MITESGEGCSDCVVILFENPVSASEHLLVRAAPDLIHTLDEVQDIQAVELFSSVTNARIWKARILLTNEARDRSVEFVRSSNLDSRGILVSIGDRPLQVLTGAELGGVMLLGEFESEAELASTLGRKPSGRVENQTGGVHLMDPSVSDAVVRADALIEQNRRDQERLHQIDEALRKGDRVEARRLIETLKE
jgi:hypothetical protein